MGPDTIKIKEAMKQGYRPCLDLNLLCEIYGCTIDDLSITLGEGQNLIYFDKWQWNIAYEENRRPCHDSGYYGNPFYDFFSSEGGYQWTSQSRYWKRDERSDHDWTPEESIRILNAFTEIMHWRDLPDHVRTLSRMSKLVFEGAESPQQGQKFQEFLKDREKSLILQDKW
jgi:hypothetical protein